MEFLYGQIIALHWRKKTLDSYRQGRLLQQLDSLQTGAEFTYNLSANHKHIKTKGGGATQKLKYDARGNIVGVVDGNRNSTRENWKMGKPSDILTLRPNETIIKTIKGDCWGPFGVLHSQPAGTITLTDQRILFRGSVGRDSNP